MDTDKDGLLSASDLVAAFGAHGKSIGSGDAQVGSIYIVIILSEYHDILRTDQTSQPDPTQCEGRTVFWSALSY